MNQVEQEAVQTYQKNLAYFETNHPELYKKLITLEVAISDGLYQEHYSLEYKEEGYFDIQNLSDYSFLYGENSQTYTKKLLKTVDLKRTGSVFEGQQRFDIKEEDFHIYDHVDSINSSLWATARIIHYNQENAPKYSSKMVKLHKFIFLDTGLGLHIPSIVKKFSVNIAFIFEKNLEIFRLSLFVTNYAELSLKTKLYFSIMDGFELLQYTFTSFLNEAFNHNLYIKFLPFSKEYQKTLYDLQSITISQNHIMYPYQAYMARSFSVAQKVTQGACFLNVSTPYSLSPLTEKPVLILASGPSLQNNIDWILEHKNNFIIVAVLSSCQYLFHHKITPDIVVHIDPQEEACLSIIKDMDMSNFDNSTLIFGSSVHKSAIEKFKRDDIVFIEEATTFKVGCGFYTLPSIGEYAAMLPLILGAKTVFLLGLDLSLDPNTMKDHIDLHVASQVLLEVQDDESVKFQGSICYVRGNFLDQIPSKPNFRLSLTQFSKAVDAYKRPHQNIYNLSNGAYLEGTIPLQIDKIAKNTLKNIDKDGLRGELRDFLRNNCSCEFRDVDKIYIQQQLQNAQNILEECKQISHLKPKEIENYLFRKLLPFVQNISEMNRASRSDLGEILFEYFKITLSFIFDIFNTKDLLEPKKHIRSVDLIVLMEVEKIVSTYYKTVEKFYNEGEAALSSLK